MKPLPKQYDARQAEPRWQQHWRTSGVYRFRDDKPRAETFVIDTPPPTVSGLLHMGHIFSYAQCDFIARYRRMKGEDVFYPMGFDDNGLPTERLVEKVKKKRASDYDSREEFIAVCTQVSEEARREFRALFESVALSVDWAQEYHTISPEVRALSQASFLDLYAKGEIERRLQPFFWDPVDQTAIAQAEIVDAELASSWNDIWFGIDGSEEKILIGTTRPELIPACVAIFYHPDDARYQHLHGKQAITPLFGVRVPILTDETVDPEKGTGIMMCCTFGDEADIDKWRRHKLPMRVVLNKYGKIEFGVQSSEFSNRTPNPELWTLLQGKKVSNKDPNHPGARETIIDRLRASGDLKESKPITHTVKCAERSGAPLEILPTPQWFVKVMDKKEALKGRAADCVWYPDWMKLRMDQWIDGLNADWCISRQRYFGVPFPVWYSRRAGEEGKILLADPAQLPCNPLTDLPTGYSRDEVEPDADVMDTWATSSLTPQINARSLCLSHRERPESARRIPGEGFIPRDILDYARTLRSEQTDAESLIWQLLRRQSFGVKFRRQHPIERYIVDFCCVEKKLVVELDGSQHAEDKEQRYDALRTAYLESQGYRVLRFWNNEALQRTDDVMQAIWDALHPLPNLPAEDSASPSGRGEERHNKLYPADLRPQAHEIIRTWAFYTLVKSHLHADCIPWKQLMISGWCLAADKTKMSKSKGNVVTPVDLIAEHGADAVRYWAATSRLGQDTAFSTDLLKIGRKLVTKLWNCGQFAAPHLAKRQAMNHPITAPFDRWMIGRLQRTISQATAAFEAYEYADALRAIDHCFWNDFCDNYLELIKKRIYAAELERHLHPAVPAAHAMEAVALLGQEQEVARHIAAQQQSAIHTVQACLQVFLRLYAPFLPHVTEEIFGHLFPEDYAHYGSLHARGLWPDAAAYRYDPTEDAAGAAALEILDAIRKAKSERNLSIKFPVQHVTVAILDPGLPRTALEPFVEDLQAAGNVETLSWESGATSESERLAIECQFAAESAAQAG